MLDHLPGGAPGPFSSGPAERSHHAVHPPPAASRAGRIVSVVTGVVAFLCLGAGTTTFVVVDHLTATRDSTGRPAAQPTAAQPTAAPVATPTDPVAGPPEDGVVHTGDLEGIMMERPEGARQWPGVKAAEALTDTTAAADLAGLGMGVRGDLGEYVLDDVGFTDGYLRRWIDKRGAYVTVRIYRFDHPGGGEEFTTVKAGGADSRVWGNPRRDGKGGPGAVSFVQPKVKKSLQQVLVIGGSSDIAILVTTQQRPPATTTVAESVFGAERRRL